MVNIVAIMHVAIILRIRPPLPAPITSGIPGIAECIVSPMRFGSLQAFGATDVPKEGVRLYLLYLYVVIN
jgi:hypothetical protein